MSTPNETILIQIDIAANNQRLVELTKQLNENREAQKALTQAGKDGRVSTDELAAGQVRLKQQAADLTGEMRVLTKANADQDKATKAAAGSINQLRAELAKGTAAYNALSEAERDNTEQGQRLQAANKAISDRLKELEKAIGDTRRNVGNYKEGIIDALKETNLFGVNIGQTAENLKGGLTQGLNIAKAGFGSLKAAIVSTGIGALVILLGSLYEYLTRTDEGAENLAAGLAGVKAGAEVLTGEVVALGKSLYDAFTNPQAAIKSIGKFLVDVVSNPKKAFNDFVNGLESGFTRVKTRIAEASSAAVALSRANDVLEDAEIDAIARNAEAEKQIGRLTLAARDRSKSDKERLASLAQADALETQVLNRTLAVERIRLVNLQKENEESRRRGLLQDDARRKEQEQIAKIDQLQGAAAEAQQGRQNRRAALLEQIAADERALADAAAARIAAEGVAADKALSEELRRNERQRKEEETARKEKQAADDAAYARDLDGLERNLSARRLALESDRANGLVTKEQYEARLNVIDEGGFAARVLLARHYNQDVAKAENEQAKAHNALLEKQTDKQRSEYQKLLGEAQSFGQNIGAVFGQTLADSNATLKDFAKQALILILDMLQKQILAQQAAATAASLAQPDSVATFGATGLARAAVLNALITAAFEAAKGVIGSFATGGVPSETGGIIRGAGTGTSDSIIARVSNGESIINARSTEMFRPLLSHLNQLGGGAAFPGYAVGGIPSQRSGAPDGGFIARTLGQQVGIDYNQLARIMSQHPTFVQVADINNAQARRAQVRNLSTLS